MTMYASSWAALVAAFNTSVFSELKGPKWGQFIRDGWGSDHVDIRQLLGEMNQKDWIAQAGNVQNLLRRELPFIQFAWLQATHIFDLDELATHLANPYNGLKTTLVPSLLMDDRISSKSRLKTATMNLGGIRAPVISPLLIRAIRVELYPNLPTLDGVAKQNTINNWQTQVRKIVNGYRAEARERAMDIIEHSPDLARNTDTPLCNSV